MIGLRIGDNVEAALDRLTEALKPPAADAILPGEKLHACPKCMSTLPAASVLVLRSWVTRNGVLVSIPTGERVACQAPNCNHQFSLHAGGTWQHSPHAEPMTAAPPNPRGDAPTEPAHPPGDPRPWPQARQRPAV